MPPASARMGPLAPTMPAPPPLPVQQPSRQAAFAQLPWRPPRTTCSKRQLVVRAGRSGTGTLPPESAHRWATMKTASMAQCRAQQPGPAHEPRGRCAGRCAACYRPTTLGALSAGPPAPPALRQGGGSSFLGERASRFYVDKKPKKSEPSNESWSGLTPGSKVKVFGLEACAYGHVRGAP